MTRFFKFIFKTFLILLLLAVILIGVSYGLLQTSYGKNTLQEFVNSQLKSPETTINISGLGGSIPFSPTLKSISIADKNGVWLKISDAKLNWNFSLQPTTFYAENIAVAKVELLREPLTGEDNEPLKFEIPNLPRIVAKKISVPEIIIAPEFTGEKQVISVSGSIRTFYDTKSEKSLLEIKSLEGVKLHAKAEVNNNSFDITLDEAPNGIAGKLLKLNATDNLSAHINGSGLFPNNNGTAIIKASDAELLNAGFTTKGNSNELALDVNAVATYPATEFYDQLREITGKQVNLKINADIRNKGTITIRQAEINAGNISAKLDGLYGDEVIKLGYSVNITSLQPLVNKPGSMALQGKAEGKDGEFAISGKAQGELDKFKNILLSYDVLNDDENLRINSFGIEAEGLKATLGGNIDISSKSMDLAFDAVVSDLKKFSGNIGGVITAKGTAKGDFENVKFNLDSAASKLSGLPSQGIAVIGNKLQLSAEGEAATKGNVKLNSFTANGQFFNAKGSAEYTNNKIKADFKADITDTTKLAPALKGSMTGRIKLQGTAEAPEGNANLTLTSKGQTLDADGDFAIRKDVISLKKLKGKTNGITFNGELDYKSKTSLADGKLNIDAKDLSGLNAFLTEKISGSGNIAAIASGKSGKQLVEANGKFTGISYSTIKIGSADFKIASADINKFEGLNANAVITNMTSGNNLLDKITFDAKGKSSKEKTQTIDFRLNASVQKPETGIIDSSGQITAKMPDWDLMLSKLSGNYGKYKFALKSPANIKQKQQVTEIVNLALNLNEAAIAANGKYSASNIDIKITADNLRLGQFTDGKLRGELDAVANITGSSAKPIIKATAKLDKLATEETGRLPLGINANIDYAGNSARANIVATQGKGHITANAEVPVKLSLEPFVFDMPKTSTLKGDVVVDMDLAEISPLFLESDQTLRGKVDGNIKLGGTIENPKADGSIDLAKARYENLSTGTLLENMRARLTTDGNRVILNEIYAKTGKGNITASGNAMLSEPYTITAQADLKDSELMNREEVSGTINGGLKISGTIPAPVVNGTLVLGPMEIQIPEQSEVSISNVKINNPDVLPKQKWQKDKKQKDEKPTAIKLDIKVSAPAKVFVRGRGLDTEMRGDLKITGTSGTPKVNGQLRTVRGIFNFLDRELAIEEGIMDFRGGIPPSPYLNIVANATANEVTAGIKLTGPVSEPALKLTSTPNLPEDEILSRLLFGRELRGITPMQGAQLLQALTSLRGGGKSFDPVGDIRKAIGVDRLSVDANESGDVTVGAGKYITDKVYLGVEGGAGENSSKVKAEIEATKSITVEAESSANSNGARINWKHDY